MDNQRLATSEKVGRTGDGAGRRHKLRQHAASLATGVLVFLGSIGLMQAVKPPAGGGSAAVAKEEAPALRGGASSGSSGAGAVGAGAEEDRPAAPIAQPGAPIARPAAPIARPAAPIAPPAAQAGAGVVGATPDTAAQIMGMPSVYIHVLNDGAREQARLLAPALREKGIALAGIKVVDAGPRSSDLRYFRPSEKEEALRVQAALLSLGLPAGRLKSISGFETRAVPRQYELWLVSDYRG